MWRATKSFGVAVQSPRRPLPGGPPRRGRNCNGGSSFARNPQPPVARAAGNADPMAQLLAALALSGAFKEQPTTGSSPGTSAGDANTTSSALPPLSSLFQDQPQSGIREIDTPSDPNGANFGNEAGRRLLTWSEAVPALAPNQPMDQRARTARGVAAATAPFDAPRDAAITAGVIPPLVALLVEAADAFSNDGTIGTAQQEAMMSPVGGRSPAAISTPEEVPPSSTLADLMEAASHAAEALGSLTGWPTVDDDARRDAAACGALPALAVLLRHASTAPAAAEAVAGLVRCAPLADTALDAGVLPPLAKLLETAADDATALVALEALARMAECESPRRMIVQDPTVIPTVVRLLCGWAAAGLDINATAPSEQGGELLSPDAERCIVWASLLTDALVKDSTLHDGLAASGILPALLSVLGVAEIDPEAPPAAAGALSDAAAAGPALREAIAVGLPTLVAKLPSAGTSTTPVNPLTASDALDAISDTTTVVDDHFAFLSDYDEETAATAVWWLATEAPTLHSDLMTAGVIPKCAALIEHEAMTATVSGTAGPLVAFAVVVLLHLTEGSDKARDAVVASGALPHLISLLLAGGLDARGTRCVADLLAAVAAGGGGDAAAASRRRAAKEAGAVEALQAVLLRAGAGTDEQLRVAVKAALDALRR